MTKLHIQMAGLITLSLLAAGLLSLIAYALYLMGSKITPDGKVPVLDAGLFTASLLAYQLTVGRIGSIWESQERSTLAEGLQNSSPQPIGVVPSDAVDGAQAASNAAQAETDRLSEATVPN